MRESPYTCPYCGNIDGSLQSTSNHLRSQVNVMCEVCSRSWVHKFKEVNKEDIIRVNDKERTP